MSEVIETRPICKQKGRYIGWPTVGTGPDGTVYVVFSGDRDAHICPFGKSYLISSQDGGLTWSDPRIVNDTPLDDRDTGLCALADGSLALTWFASYYYRSYEVLWGGYRQGAYSEIIQPWADWEKEVKAITPHDLDKWVPFIQWVSPGKPKSGPMPGKNWVATALWSTINDSPRTPADSASGRGGRAMEE